MVDNPTLNILGVFKVTDLAHHQLNLLRKNWRPSNQPDAGPSNVGGSSESPDPTTSDTRKRGINPDEDDPNQSAKRAKLNHSPSGTSEGDLDFNEYEEPSLHFPIPVFRFEAHQASATPVASADISHAIVQVASERNSAFAALKCLRSLSNAFI